MRTVLQGLSPRDKIIGQLQPKEAGDISHGVKVGKKRCEQLSGRYITHDSEQCQRFPQPGVFKEPTKYLVRKRNSISSLPHRSVFTDASTLN